ncbi:DUF6680 family protein [Cereibacter sphaeroides]|uniref:DUF6680 family protein n=1 Tax=Cereibacter sphaeroides TaxID=1063 RepID=UPI0039E3AB66
MAVSQRPRPRSHCTATTTPHNRETVPTQRLLQQPVKIKVDQLEILEGNYLPQGWNDDDIEQRVARKAMIEVLGGRRPILFEVYNPRASHGPYPPAPKSNER